MEIEEQIKALRLELTGVTFVCRAMFIVSPIPLALIRETLCSVFDGMNQKIDGMPHLDQAQIRNSFDALAADILVGAELLAALSSDKAQ